MNEHEAPTRILLLEDSTDDAEEALRNSQQRYSDLLYNIGLLAVMLDRDGAMTFCNDFLLQLTGWTWDEVRGQNWFDTFRPAEEREASKGLYALTLETKHTNNRYQNEIITRDGSRRSITWSSTILRDTAGVPVGYANIGEDITERLLAESMLRESESLNRAIVDSAGDAIITLDSDRIILTFNAAAVKIYGYEAAEIIGRDMRLLMSEDEWTYYTINAKQFREVLAPSGITLRREAMAKRKDGTLFPIEVAVRAVDVPNIYMETVIVRDISERNDALEALRRSQERYRALIEAIPQIAWTADPMGTVDYLSTQWNEYSGHTFEEMTARTWTHFIHPQEYGQAHSSWECALQTGEPFQAEYRLLRFDGVYRWFLSRGVPLKDAEGNVLRWFGTFTDIDDQKRTEATQRFLAELGASVRPITDPQALILTVTEAVNKHLNVIRCAVIEVDVNQAQVTINPGYHRDIPGVSGEYALAAFGEEVLVSLRRGETVLVEDTRTDPRTAKYYDGLYRSMGAQALLVAPRMKNGVWVAALCIATYDETRAWTAEEATTLETVVEQLWLALENARLYQATQKEIAERKQAQALLQQTESLNRAIFDTAAEGIITINEEGVIQKFNAAAVQMYGYPADEIIGQDMRVLIPEAKHSRFLETLAMFQASPSPSTLVIRREGVGKRKDGSLFALEFARSATETTEGYLNTSVMRDITERKAAEQLIERQFERLAALRSIDTVISSSQDKRFTLQYLLDQIQSLLHVDAVCVLLYNRNGHCLESTASVGLRAKGMEPRSIRIGDGPIGGAALERRTIHIEDTGHGHSDSFRDSLVEREGFVAYTAVPLVAKGQVAGMLELYHRTVQSRDQEWHDFLKTLAGQTAIAVDNATLFEDLQRTNMELTLAYDSTIEGWSRAMDLRDKETEGHTLRVTEMTVQLAKLLGVDEREQEHMRRGALLHDIGKMGIPDAILLKPGALTDEEQRIMRQHTDHSFDLLHPIAFLRPALDIPLYHHERWDGTGYPRGLKGAQIPLAARICAVADVWDALRSDRPYRPAWSVERVRDYIRSNAGSHFDPAIVEVFMSLDVTGFTYT